MTSNQFWDIIGRVHEAGRGDMKRKCELIGEELRKLSTEDVQAFDGYYTDFYYQAYRWELWGAASLSGIVTDSGWIPPLAVVAGIIKAGKFVKDDKCCYWPAVALDENLYWRAILELGPRKIGDLTQRWPRIRVAKLQHDFTTPKTDDYTSWVRSLKERGLE